MHCFLSLLVVVGFLGELSVAQLYDRNPKVKQNVFRFLTPCGPKLTTKTPYKKIPVNRSFIYPTKKDFHYYMYSYQLGKCDIDHLCFEELIRASEHGNDELVLHYLQNNTSFWLPAHDVNPYQWYVKEMFQLFEKYNVTAKRYTFNHAVDETNGYAHKDIIAFYQVWKKSYRWYWWDVPVYQELHAQGQLDWLPSTFLRTPEIPFTLMKKSSQRTFNLTFIGNTNTNRRRQFNVKEIGVKMNISVHGIIKSTGGAFSVNFAGGSVYLDTMLDSRFCLQLKGKSSECHRFYESLECGCIPVIIDTYESSDYKWHHHVNLEILKTFGWRKGHELPFIWVNDVNTFKMLYEDYLASEDGLRRMDNLQQDVMEWWGSFKEQTQNYYKQEFCPN